MIDRILPSSLEIAQHVFAAAQKDPAATIEDSRNNAGLANVLAFTYGVLATDRLIKLRDPDTIPETPATHNQE